jgi:hypothetical protein
MRVVVLAGDFKLQNRGSRFRGGIEISLMLLREVDSKRQRGDPLPGVGE